MKLTVQIFIFFSFVGCALDNTNSTQKHSSELACNYFLFDSITNFSSIKSYSDNSNLEYSGLELEVLMEHTSNFDRIFKTHINNYELIISEHTDKECSSQFVLDSEIYKIYYSENSRLDKELRESINFQKSEFLLTKDNNYLIIVSHPLSRTGSQMQNYYIHILDFKRYSVFGFQSHGELTTHLLHNVKNVEVLKSFKYDYWSKQYVEYGIPILEIDDSFEKDK